LSDAESA